jgi:hypothetical protein
MDSVVAIAKGIAELDTDQEVKDCLSALLNLELLSSNSNPVAKAAYIKEIEQKISNWVPKTYGDEK